jgi:hypothetical protein
LTTKKKAAKSATIMPQLNINNGTKRYKFVIWWMVWWERL